MRPKGYPIPSGYIGYVNENSVSKGKSILFPTETEYLEYLKEEVAICQQTDMRKMRNFATLSQ